MSRMIESVRLEAASRAHVLACVGEEVGRTFDAFTYFLQAVLYDWQWAREYHDRSCDLAWLLVSLGAG